MPRFNVERSIEIAAPIETAYASVRDFRQWPVWSPWLIAEPDCRLTYAEDGSQYSWDGEVVGAGTLALVREDAPNRLECDLNFIRPWKSHADVRFEFQSTGDGTRVTWTMDSALPWFLFWMKPMMVAALGMDYDRGLAMLKEVVETGVNPSKLTFDGPSDYAGCTYVGVRRSGPFAEIGEMVAADFGKLHEWSQKAGITPAAPPLAIYHKFNMARDRIEYTCAYPVQSAPASTGEEVTTGTIPPTRIYRITHTGPYRHLGNAWSTGMLFARNKVFRQDKSIPPFEIYETDPDSTPETEAVTRVCFPLR